MNSFNIIMAIINSVVLFALIFLYIENKLNAIKKMKQLERTLGNYQKSLPVQHVTSAWQTDRSYPKNTITLTSSSNKMQYYTINPDGTYSKAKLSE